LGKWRFFVISAKAGEKVESAEKETKISAGCAILRTNYAAWMSNNFLLNGTPIWAYSSKV